MYQFVAGDTGSILRVTCMNDSDKSGIDITGSTVVLRWYDRRTDTFEERTMTAFTPTFGIAQYQFLADELIPPEMAFETQITDGSGKFMRSLELISVDVREPLNP